MAKAHPLVRAKVHGEERKAAVLGSGTSTGLGKKKKKKSFGTFCGGKSRSGG